MLKGIDFIEHKKFISDKINYLKEYIEEARDNEYNMGVINT